MLSCRLSPRALRCSARVQWAHLLAARALAGRAQPTPPPKSPLPNPNPLPLAPKTTRSGGIYHEKRCALKPARLDHAVVLVGYGSNRGRDFWIVRNSWSKYWGVDGYVKIRRSGNDCGIASDALYALVAPSARVPRAPERARAAALARGRATTAAAV